MSDKKTPWYKDIGRIAWIIIVIIGIIIGLTIFNAAKNHREGMKSGAIQPYLIDRRSPEEIIQIYVRIEMDNFKVKTSATQFAGGAAAAVDITHNMGDHYQSIRLRAEKLFPEGEYYIQRVSNMSHVKQYRGWRRVYSYDNQYDHYVVFIKVL